MSETERPSALRRVFRGLLLGLGGLTLFFLLATFVLALLAGRGERIPSRVLLELDLERGLVEYVPEDPLNLLRTRDQLTVREVVEALQRAAGDDRVVGLVARVGGGGLGGAQIEEVRSAVATFRASGKPAILFSETFGDGGPGRGGYLLATAFEEIHLQPSGEVGLTGLVAETPFLAGALDRLGIDPRIGQRHEYKTAAEMFTEEGLTEPNRETLQSLLEATYEHLVAAIAAGRNLEPALVRGLIDTGPHFGDEAVRAGLIDGIGYRDEVYDALRARVGGDPRFLNLRAYVRRTGELHARGPTIALIYGTGTVRRGRSGFDPITGGASMGSETLTRAFRDAIEDDAVRAIVFRIDSPGGSYVASDAIWRETVRAREAGKPVIVTMGNLAASGGYFVAMAADHILAQPTTLTGSIGVYGGKVVIRELSENLGITWGTVQVGGNATMWSPIEDYSPAELARRDASLDRIYQDFVTKAAAGRDLSTDSLDAIARGRVWTGADALRLGLVDELGGFELALVRAREAAGLAPDARIRLQPFPRPRGFLEILLDQDRDRSYPTEVGELAATLEALRPLLAAAARLGLTGEVPPLLAPRLPALP